MVRPYGFRREGCPRKRVRLSDCRAHSPGHSDGEAGRQCARSITLRTAELRRPRQMPTESRTPLWPRKAAGEARSTEQTSWNRIFRRMGWRGNAEEPERAKDIRTTDHHRPPHNVSQPVVPPLWSSTPGPPPRRPEREASTRGRRARSYADPRNPVRCLSSAGRRRGAAARADDAVAASALSGAASRCAGSPRAIRLARRRPPPPRTCSV